VEEEEEERSDAWLSHLETTASLWMRCVRFETTTTTFALLDEWDGGLGRRRGAWGVSTRNGCVVSFF
jgi:hypothetical protein